MINSNLYKKSYLLEVFNLKTNKITDAFCFSVPPETEELTYSHRNSQTKTYGGLCVDRYGNEAVKISLSGTTVNQEVKYIYRSSLGSKELTGEQEIYFLRDLLDNAAEDSNAELRLYDLSKSLFNYESDSKSYIENWWIVYLESFKIKRAKDKPMAYQYNIEFVGLPQKSTTQGRIFTFEKIKIVNPKDGTTEITEKVKNSPAAIFAKIDNGIAKMRIGINAISSIYDVSNNFLNQMSTVSDKLNDFEKVFNDYAEAIQNFRNLKTKAIKETVRIGKTFIRSSVNIALDYYQSVLSSVLLLKDSVTVWKDLFDEIKKVKPEELYGKEKLNSLETTANELNNSEITAFYVTLEGVNEIIANTSRMIMPSVIINTDLNGNSYPVVSYGQKKITIKDGDSIENISNDQYGTTDYVYMLEMVNNMSDDDLKTGEQIIIPVLEPEQNNFNNNIFETESPMGKDVALTEDGDIDCFGGDFSLITGKENLNQAVILRLSAYMGSNVRNVVYGLRNTIGENTSSNSYLLASIKQTLSREPRIKEIENISYKGIGDQLSISISYIDIGNEQNNFQEVI